MRRTRKPVAAAIAIALAGALCVGGAIAWLTAETDKVENTFTVGNIDITLLEHDYDPATNSLMGDRVAQANSDYKMVPGNTMPKDPTVTVKTGSEDCWVFVKVEESGGDVIVGDEKGFGDFIDYAIDANNWTQGDGTSIPANVWYCYAEDVTADRSIKVLLNEQVAVKDTVTKEMMDAFDVDGDGALNETEQKNLPKLTFTAYAVQMANIDTAADAWSVAKTGQKPVANQ